MNSNSSHFGNPLVTSNNVSSKQYSNNPYKRRPSARRKSQKGDNNIMKHNNNDTYLQTQHLPQSPSSIHQHPSMIVSTMTPTSLTYLPLSSSCSTSFSYDSASSIGLPSLHPANRRYGKSSHQFDSFMLEELQDFDEMFGSSELVDNHEYCNIYGHDCQSSSGTCLDSGNNDTIRCGTIGIEQSDSRDEKGTKENKDANDSRDNETMINKLVMCGTYLTDISCIQKTL